MPDVQSLETLGSVRCRSEWVDCQCQRRAEGVRRKLLQATCGPLQTQADGRLTGGVDHALPMEPQLAARTGDVIGGATAKRICFEKVNADGKTESTKEAG